MTYDGPMLILPVTRLAGLGDAGPIAEMSRSYIEQGLVMRAVGDTMIIAPPFVTTDAQLDELVEKAWRALELTHRALGPATP